jgi:hypothetical protein
LLSLNEIFEKFCCLFGELDTSNANLLTRRRFQGSAACWLPFAANCQRRERIFQPLRIHRSFADIARKSNSSPNTFPLNKLDNHPLLVLKGQYSVVFAKVFGQFASEARTVDRQERGLRKDRKLPQSLLERDKIVVLRRHYQQYYVRVRPRLLQPGRNPNS